MFENFISFVQKTGEAKVSSIEEFVNQYNGQTFLNGLYRLHDKKDIQKWTTIVERTFPMVKGEISVFGYDWQGRHFALYSQTNTVILLEPGTGEVFDMGCDYQEFHNKEIPNNHITCLASEYFQEWFEANNHFILPHDKCVGYKIPLFLNGKDELSNLEISDMEVYWEIMMPLINM